MWIYDAVADKWEDMKPKCDWGRKESPGSEAQMAYSPKHKKIVAVGGKDTFVYDFATNIWSKVATEEGQHASDSRSVFAYDSASDVFLLYNALKGEWDKARDLRAFDLKTGKWEKLAPQGAAVPTDCRKGYYDPEHNVLVIAGQGPVWVYRYKRAGGAAPAKAGAAVQQAPAAAPAADKPAALSPTAVASAPAPVVRTPEQVCAGWFSSAKTYRSAGLTAEARRCLNNIVRDYPGTEHAARAQEEMGRL
jgi:hypothetical protein